MAFIPHLKYDIFISYSHDDNVPEIEGQRGWIDVFEKRLSIKLLKRCGEPVSVWRDRILSRAQLFDQTIRDAITSSAILLPLVTPRYLRSDYCRQEIEWFCAHAKQDEIGLVVGDYLRVFPVLLYNITHQQWPSECHGTSAFMFHDAEGDELGEPLDLESIAFKMQLRKLVDEICTVLTQLREQVSHPDKINTHTEEEIKTHSKLFIACSADDLRPERRQLATALAQKNISITSDIPPPYDEESHTECTIKALQEADLCVHLLGSLAGEPIDPDSPDKTYPLEQARLGLEHAHSQLVLIPDGIELEDIENVSYRRFMGKLRTLVRDTNRLEIVQTGHHQMLDEILAKKCRLEALADRENSIANGSKTTAFIDLHMQDINYALDLITYLNDHGVVPVMIPEVGITPKTAMSLFEENLKRAHLFIVVFGQVARSWVENRLNEAFKLILCHSFLTRIGVYITPPRKSQTDMSFPPFVNTMLNMEGFNQQALEGFLKSHNQI